MLDRAKAVDEQFIKRISRADFPPIRNQNINLVELDKNVAIELFDSQIKARHLDLIARELKDKGLSFYTIASGGHEGNAVFGHIFRHTDMAFLHYRSCAFYLQRARQVTTVDAIDDVLLSLVASARDPISSGRHKVFGSVILNIPPQTSTIASHLPKSLGAALSITRAKELQIKSLLPHDSVILCSFGDASVNHAVAQTTLNACSWIASQPYPLPIVFICEDNGLGISVPTPVNWIENSVKGRPNIHYITCDGLDIVDCYIKAKQAEDIARNKRQPVFLHMRCVRLMGHAGSDIQTQYLSQKTIDETEANDPLLHTAGILYRAGLMSLTSILDLYEDNRALVNAKALKAVSKPKLTTAKAIMSSIIPTITNKGNQSPLPSLDLRIKIFGDTFKQLGIKRNLCQLINFALTDLMLQYDNILLFGEDVGKKGGVYRVTADIQARFGQRRVFDTLLDETTILGTAVGLAHNGFLPIPEIQFLAYLHNAEDQIRGEAATLSFFSNGQYKNPMVIRVAALAYQKGFGGHFHNDNSIAILRDLPGVIVACPSNGADAVKMLRTCVDMAQNQGRVVVFLEPIALYMTKDLHDTGDNAWLAEYPSINDIIPFGDVGCHGSGDTVIITYGNGYYLSRQAAKILADKYKIQVKIIDIRWLSPLPEKSILCEVRRAKRILIVDEGRKSGSISEGLMTLFMENSVPAETVRRIVGEDSFIPLGDAWKHVLPSRDSIISAICAMHTTNKEINNG